MEKLPEVREDGTTAVPGVPVDAVLGELEPVAVRQFDIHQRNVKMRLGEQLACSAAGSSGLNPIAFVLERLFEHEAQGFFVFGYQDFPLIHSLTRSFRNSP